MAQWSNTFNPNFSAPNYYGNAFMPVVAPVLGMQNVQKPVNTPPVDYYDGQKPSKKSNLVFTFLLTAAALAALAVFANSNTAKKLVNSASSTGSNPPAQRKPLKNRSKTPKTSVKSAKRPSASSKKKKMRVLSKGPKTPESLANKAIHGLLSSNSPDRAALGQIEDIFKQNTGINLYCPEPQNIKDFSMFFDLIFTGKFYQKMDSEIKHIIIGHGTGSSVDGTWRFLGTGENVFDFIENNIPKGEKVLLITCENAQNRLRPGVGSAVNTVLLDRAKPGKVVESGKRAIIGTLTQYHPKIDYFEGFNPPLNPQNVQPRAIDALRDFTDENPEIVANVLSDWVRGGDGFGSLNLPPKR